MSQFTIDIDAEAVFLDGAWYTREDLARRIKAMLDEGDFTIATPSLALQELTQTMQGVRTLAFRCTPELAEALGHLAARLGQSVGALVREAATQYVSGAQALPMPQPMQESPLRAAPPAQAVVLEARGPGDPTGPTPEDLPKAVVEPAQAVLTGPVALRAAGVVPEVPAELDVASGSSPNEPLASEHRWFKQ